MGGLFLLGSFLPWKALGRKGLYDEAAEREKSNDDHGIHRVFGFDCCVYFLVHALLFPSSTTSAF